MCFSATASFGSGIVLTAIGTVTLAGTKSRAERPFAAIPLLFGIQQVAEGFTWLTLMHPEYMAYQQAAIHSFLFFAHVLWPVWIPFSVVCLEKDPIRRMMFSIMLAMAVLLSASEVYCMIVYPAMALVNEHHIDYTVAFPRWYAIVTEILYFIVTLLPCYISTVKRMWIFGYCLTITLVLSAIFYKLYVVSVWCFFAAITSVVIYFILKGIQRETANLKERQLFAQR